MSRKASRRKQVNVNVVCTITWVEFDRPGERPDSDYVHPDDQTQPTFEMTPEFKTFTITRVTQLVTLSSIPQITNPKCIGSHIV